MRRCAACRPTDSSSGIPVGRTSRETIREDERQRCRGQGVDPAQTHRRDDRVDPASRQIVRRVLISLGVEGLVVHDEDLAQLRRPADLRRPGAGFGEQDAMPSVISPRA